MYPYSKVRLYPAIPYTGPLIFFLDSFFLHKSSHYSIFLSCAFIHTASATKMRRKLFLIYLLLSGKTWYTVVYRQNYCNSKQGFLYLPGHAFMKEKEEKGENRQRLARSRNWAKKEQERKEKKKRGGSWLFGQSTVQ